MTDNEPKESSPSVPAKSSIQSKPQQMELPLGAERDFAFIAMDGIDGRIFLQFLTSYRPATIADLRHFIRFDLVGVDAADVHLAIASIRARYIRYSVPFHTMENDFLRHRPNSIASSIVTRLRTDAGDYRGPFLALVHTAKHAQLVAPYVAAAGEKLSTPFTFPQRDQSAAVFGLVDDLRKAL